MYSLVALGYTMVYGVMRMINFAHGDFFMIGSYLGFTLISSALIGGAIPLWLALVVLVVLAMIGVGLLGIIVERAAYRPLRKSSRLTAVVSAIGVSIFLQNAVMLIWGPRYRTYPPRAVPNIIWQVGDIYINFMQILILAVSFVLMIALYFFVQHTTVGAAIRATAIDHDVASVKGIDVDQIIRLIFLIGPALGAAAGVLLGLYYRQIHFTVGWTYGLKPLPLRSWAGRNIPGAMVEGFSWAFWRCWAQVMSSPLEKMICVHQSSSSCSSSVLQGCWRTYR